MSGRSRGRQNPNQDADEERRLWKEVKDKAKDVDTMVARSNEIGREIIEVEEQQDAIIKSGKLSDATLDERLDQLYRENVKLSEDVTGLIEGKSNEMNLLDSISVLAGLREASEDSAAQLQASQGHRAASGKLSRGPKKTGSKNNSAVAATTEDVEKTPAAPSPRIILGGPGSRLNAKEKSSRSGSIATTRETSVKIEDGAESVASSADGVSTTGANKGSASNNRPSNRLVLQEGEIVFCRHDPKTIDTMEGEGILCRVTAVIGEGKQRRYEVQDADTQGDPPPPQRASVAQLMQIPHTNKGLSDLSKGKQVLAQYPDTTTFYKAEVNEPWRSKVLAAGEKGELVRLNFQEDEEPREVERRFVLTEK
ncbi:uncharacterized protein RCC_10194 [Ramularia collo-cygni]|uniref:SGF29 C-terminal domain-containing protein n=1 Tax=Ramularia collo-cygni TaxID=112498 RepID=A0A2D3VLI7_9PEZI|nr:uncharacterized protein RCC_10194 [Ramularia collo-cygni]CZT24469.1 uncharacterized protein RCC_10194 [Ramularia collo-cygni]